MGKAYVPLGCIGLIEAALLIARGRQPERWEPTRMLPGEQDIWNSLVTRNAEFVGDYLRVDVPREGLDTSSMIERFCDYKDAQQSLRTALGEGQLDAAYIDDAGDLQRIEAKGWRTTAGQEVITTGKAWIDEGATEVCRFPFVSQSDVIRCLVQGDSPISADTAGLAEDHLGPPSPKAKPSAPSAPLWPRVLTPKPVECAASVEGREAHIAPAPSDDWEASSPAGLTGMWRAVVEVLEEVWGGFPLQTSAPYSPKLKLPNV